MKNILVPIDFTDVSLNALNYAKHIAKAFKSHIILFHSSQLLLVASEVLETVYTELAENEDDIQLKMGQLISILQSEHISCEMKLVRGLLLDEIKSVVRESTVDLIVTGTSGAKGIDLLLFGTNSTSIFENVRCPVLIVPVGVMYYPIKKIMYATDFIKGDILPMKKVCSIAQAFESEVFVAHVTKDIALFEEDDLKMDRISDLNAAEINFNNISYKLIHDDDIFDGLEKMITSLNIQLICMSTVEKGFFKKLLSKSNTKVMAYHSRIPLLIFHLEK